MKQINKKIGIGSISLLLCIMGIIFSFNFGNRVCYGDVILKYMGLNPWSNGDNGTHYTLLYSLIFFIPYTCYLSGNFAGVPAFLGYFFGVSFTFLIQTSARLRSESGNWNLSTEVSFPPRIEIAFFPS